MSPATERRANVLIAAAVLAAITAGAVAFLAGVSAGAGARDSVDCEEWSFDRGEWRSEREATARALVECDALLGMSRGEAARLLGRKPSDRARRWTIAAGAVNDYMGPGDANYLYVGFGPGDRVDRARLLYEGERASLD